MNLPFSGAISRGLKVSSIVFFIFGGVSNIEKEPETAWVEFIMAGAGPASSVVLGGIFYGLPMLSRQYSLDKNWYASYMVVLFYYGIY